MHNIDSVDNNNLDLSSKKDVANYAGSLVGKYSITAENKDVHEKIDSEKIAFQECAEKVILAQEKLEEAARNALERFDESDLSKGLKVVVCGPPHSGKSVFIRGIESMLDPNSTYVLDCTPDGEFRNFNKYYDDPQVRALREKLKREASDRGGFTEKFIKDKKEQIENWDGPLMMIDVGGKISEQNKQIIENGVHFGIILSSNLPEMEKWQEFLSQNGVETIAKVHSNYYGVKDIIKTAQDNPAQIYGSARYLERGQTVTDRGTVEAVSTLLSILSRLNNSYNESHKNDNEFSPWTVYTQEFFMGMPADRRRLKKYGYDVDVLDPKREAIPYFYVKAEDKYDRNRIWLDGALNSWTAIASACAFKLAGSEEIRFKSPNGMVKLRNMPQSEEIKDDYWEKTLVGRSYEGNPVYIVHNKASAANPISPSQMGEMSVPKLPENAIAIVSTAGPHWLRASIGLSYLGKVAGIGAFVPGEGSTLVWRKEDVNMPLGSTIEDSLDTELTMEEQPRSSVKLKYGSERFETATSNNHNEIFTEDVKDVHKLVFKKGEGSADVALVLPSDPDKLDIFSGYPTHQESWLPMWFVVLNHSQNENPEALNYQKKIARRVSEGEYQFVEKAIIHQAKSFFEKYKQDQSHDDNPRKKYKNLTRILQDSLLYVGHRGYIKDQQKFLNKSPLLPLIQQANSLRAGNNLELASSLETKIEVLLDNMVEEYGGEEEIAETYRRLVDRNDKHRGDQRIIMVNEDRKLGNEKEYAAITTPDLIMSRDDHDEDIVAVVEGLDKAHFTSFEEKFGPEASVSRRTDVIAVPPNLGIWDTADGGKQSYQPISMIIATHSTPETEVGKNLQKRIQLQFSPRDIAEHYFGAAEEFLHMDGFGKSYVNRINREDVPQIKKVIPLYRVATDLLPRAIYMMQNNTYPTGISDDALWDSTGVRQFVDQIHDIFRRQDATQEELESLYGRINQYFQQWYKEEYYGVFLDNMTKMSERAIEQDRIANS